MGDQGGRGEGTLSSRYILSEFIGILIAGLGGRESPMLWTDLLFQQKILSNCENARFGTHSSCGRRTWRNGEFHRIFLMLSAIVCFEIPYFQLFLKWRRAAHIVESFAFICWKRKRDRGNGVWRRSFRCIFWREFKLRNCSQEMAHHILILLSS